MAWYTGIRQDPHAPQAHSPRLTASRPRKARKTGSRITDNTFHVSPSLRRPLRAANRHRPRPPFHPELIPPPGLHRANVDPRLPTGARGVTPPARTDRSVTGPLATTAESSGRMAHSAVPALYRGGVPSERRVAGAVAPAERRRVAVASVSEETGQDRAG